VMTPDVTPLVRVHDRVAQDGTRPRDLSLRSRLSNWAYRTLVATLEARPPTLIPAPDDAAHAWLAIQFRTDPASPQPGDDAVH
jgi:hypothetical protein